MEGLVIQLIIGGICGAIAAAIANSKGRNVVGWFFGGFFLQLIGIIIVAVLPNLNEKRRREQRIDRENRRLREQLRQERIKGESFREHTMTRLDAHDSHLGIDTRDTSRQLTGQANQAALEHLADATEPGFANQPLPSQQQAEPIPVHDGWEGGDSESERAHAASKEAKWYYDAGGQMAGPVPAIDIFNLVRTGKLSRSSLVWAEHLDDWTALHQVDPFRQAVRV